MPSSLDPAYSQIRNGNSGFLINFTSHFERLSFLPSYPSPSPFLSFSLSLSLFFLEIRLRQIFFFLAERIVYLVKFERTKRTIASFLLIIIIDALRPSSSMRFFEKKNVSFYFDLQVRCSRLLIKL